MNPARGVEFKGEFFGDAMDDTYLDVIWARARYEAARATKTELELAKELGQLTLVTEVQDTIRNATVKLREILEVACEVASVHIKSDDTPQQIRNTIREQIRIAQNEWAPNCTQAV